ncbi:MAG: hypothetical protein A2787_05195 [Omnitrophica WOR_2 bacterium RIFCSPHIGHO2_01_FULL_48_9]|nr:MAG: hypothetical protein A3D10_08995 [Omnitrophica WOR_2 bacterium RIFCSPHIGHO2_02_FULL_48_11]OGX34008.1 MAG: hypothetical protein A2787_05195 [Omnitrophica WOR_2 bacterium RIFCSPHIGHO2_01_FULL_48_9]
MVKRNKLFYLGVLCVLPVLAGCRIDFTAESVVRDDGSLERLTMLRAQDDADKEEVLARYELPAGGGWVESRLTVVDPSTGQPSEKTVPTYSVKRVIPPANFPASDFKRYTEARDKAAANQIQVKVKDLWLVKWFTYEEQFKDVIDRDHLSEMINQVLDRALNQYRLQLNQNIPDTALLDRIVVLLKAKYQPSFDRMAQLIKEKRLASLEMESVIGQLGNDFTDEATYQLIISNIPEFDNPANRELATKAFQATETVLSSEMEPLKESIFGIHGIGMFQKYTFKIQVKMPGEILKTNATERKDDILLWQFDGGNLEQTVFAQSRKVYPLKIILLFGILGLAVVILQKGKGTHA